MCETEKLLCRFSCICHDSVSCKNWRPNVEPYPVLREENEYVGQPYDEDDMPSEVTNLLFCTGMGGGGCL